MIKAGVIGLGRMGMSHSAVINSLKNSEIVSVSDSSPFIKSLIEKHSKFNFYKDYKKMISEENLNCVVITTPTKSHFEIVKYAMEKGLHVFVEKPLCLHPEEGKELLELEKSKNLVCQVGYHNRFLGTFRELRSLIDKNALGEIKHITGEAYGPVVLKDKKSTWRTNPSEGGGCLYDYATHVINLMQFMTGKPTSVSGVLLKKIFSRNVEDAIYGNIHFENNLSGTISVNWSDYTYRKMTTKIEVFGKKGKIHADSQQLQAYFVSDPKIEGYNKGWNVRWVTDLSRVNDFYLRGEEYTDELEYFIYSIENNNTDNISSFNEANQTDIIIERFKMSDSQGEK